MELNLDLAFPIAVVGKVEASDLLQKPKVRTMILESAKKPVTLWFITQTMAW